MRGASRLFDILFRVVVLRRREGGNSVAARFRILLLLVLLVAPNARAVLAGMQEGSSERSSAGAAKPTLDEYKRISFHAQRLAESNPSEDNLFVYASSLMNLDYHSAAVIYAYALQKYPDSVRLHVGLASALGSQSDYDGAAAEFLKAADLAPADPHPLEYLLRTQAIPPAMAERVADGLLRLHRMYPQDGLILFDYEMVLSNRYNDSTSPVPSDFVEQLKEAVRLTPHLPEAYFQLGLVYDEGKAYADEVQVLRRAVQLSPLDEQYRYHLAMAYKRHGNKAAFLKEMSTIQQMLSQSGK